MFRGSARAWTITLLAIILFAFALRMVRLGDLRMWGDEGFSVYSAQRSLYAITFEGKDVDPHPPLYYYLFHFYLPLVGYSELAIRFFSVIFGTATAALIYVIGKRLFDVRVGSAAAAITALAPFAVHYSQEVRMYALVMLLSALALYFFVRLWQKETRARWLGFATAMLLTQYSLYQAAFLSVAQGVFLLPFLRQRLAFISRWLAVACAIVILFVPWLLAHSSSALTDVKEVAGDTVPMNLPTFIARGFAAIAVGTTVPFSNAFLLSGVLVAVIVVGLGIAVVRRTAQRNDWLLVALVVLPMLSLYPIYFLAPLYRGRLFSLAFVPLMLLIARSTVIIAARARLAASAIALLILAASIYSLNDYYFRYDRYSPIVEDYLPAIRAVELRAQPGDVVLFHAYWHQGYFLSHYRGAPLQYGALDKQSDLDAALSESRNVWAVVQALPHHAAEDWLAENAFSLGEEKFGQMRLLSYRAGVPARGERFADPVVFSNGIALLGYHIDDAPIESGRGAVMIQLDWQASRKIGSDFTVSVRALQFPYELDGQLVWAQSDSQPSSGTQPTASWQAGQIIADRHALPIPPGTPPGSYAIQVAMYDARRGDPANITAPDNVRGQTLVLGTVRVVRPTVAPPAPKIPSPLDARWNEIALVGLASGTREIMAGDSLPLTLYWQARAQPGNDYRTAIQIVDSSGKAAPWVIHDPGGPNFPTHLWQAGDLWLDKIALTIDPETAAGEATVLMAMVNEPSGSLIEPRTAGQARGSAVELMRIKVNTRTHRFALPSPEYPLQATFGGAIKLLGYDLDPGALQPESALALKLYWQSLDKVSSRYTVFAHLLDASGAIVAQHDSEPEGGGAPTTSWLRGEVIADEFQIQLPQNLGPGDYTLVVGMYQPASGRRLGVDDSNADRAALTQIKVRAQ